MMNDDGCEEEERRILVDERDASCSPSASEAKVSRTRIEREKMCT